MSQKERLDSIIELLHKNGFVTVKFLTEELHYSTATINRDLNMLQNQQIVRRIYGGAELYKAGKQIYSETNSPDLYAVVAEGEEEIVVLVTSFNGFKYNEAPPKDEKFLLDIKDFNISSAKVYVVNEDKMYEEEILENGEFVLKGNSFVLIKIKK